LIFIGENKGICNIFIEYIHSLRNWGSFVFITNTIKKVNYLKKRANGGQL